MKLAWVLIATISAAASAGPARDRVFCAYPDWAAGEAMGVEVWSPGGIARGGVVDSLLLEQEQYVWDVCPAATGGVLVGTGGGGKVYRFDGSTLTLIFDSPESDILCVAEEKDGTVWAGSSPDGLVYRIGRAGTGVEEFRTGASAVWCVAVRDKGVVVGTGPEGRVFECRPGKAVREIARLSLTNVLSLLALPDGTLMAAGDSPGIVQRIQADSTIMTVARLDFDEARSLCLLGPDSVGVLAVGGVGAGRAGSGLLAGRLSGPLEQIWTSPDSLALDVARGPAGVVVGGGWPGRAYLVRNADEFRQLVQIGMDQVLAVARDGSRLYLGAGSPACLYWVDDRRAKAASWRSPVIDASTVATWGRLAWMGSGGDMTVRGRTGNLGDPSSGWSSWQTAQRVDDAWRAALPDARFAQFEITLRGGEEARPALEWLRVSYQPHNRAPEIASFGLLARGQKPLGVAGRPPSAGAGGSSDPAGDDGDRYLVWTASDPDGDELAFRVAFSTYPAGEWVGLTERTTESYQLIRQGSLAEGWYRFRLEATDAPGNPEASTRQVSKIIGPWMIDDTPPVLVDASWKKTGLEVRLRVEARDNGSGVARASASVDGKNWVEMEPSDGVADSPRETFSAAMASPVLTVTVHLVDREGNGTSVAVSPPK